MKIEKSLKITADKLIPNTIELEITGESHTLANLVTAKLLEDKRCTFSAYKVPHPLIEKVMIKVSAVQKCDVTTLVLDVLKQLADEIKGCIDQFRKQEREKED